MPHRDYLASGDRAAIRHPRRDDEPEFLARVRDSAELHHPWLTAPASPAEYNAYLARLRDPSSAGFLVCDSATGALTGFVNINNITRRALQCGSLGYAAFVPYAGKGYLTQGLGLVVRRAFRELALHRLEINIQPGNVSSIALAKRAGFRLEGFSPGFLFIDGAWRDHERWAMTSEMLGTAADRAAQPPAPPPTQPPTLPPA